MTRKDFQLIADALKDAKEAAKNSSDPVGSIHSAVLIMARELRKTNPRFNRDRFLAACGF